MTSIQLDITDARMRDIDEMAAKCGLASRKDVFENALTLLEWAIREREKKRVIASVDESSDTFYQVRLEALEKIVKSTSVCAYCNRPFNNRNEEIAAPSTSLGRSSTVASRISGKESNV